MGLPVRIKVEIRVRAERHAGELLIDGRNRREACRRAGVVPDKEPVLYTLAGLSIAGLPREKEAKGVEGL